MDHLSRGNQYFVNECYDDAAKAYTKAVGKLLGIEQFGALFGRARCRIEIGNINLAVSDLTQCISLDPDHQLSNYYLGYWLMKQNATNYEILQKCKHYLNTANEANPDNKQNRIESALTRVTNKLEKLGKTQAKVSATQNNTTVSEEKQAESVEVKNSGSSNGSDMAATTTTTTTEEKVKTIRDTWYQSPSTVTYTLYIKKLTKNDVKIEFASNTVSFDLALPGGETHFRKITLFDTIIPDKCKFTVTKYKINCVLVKAKVGEWIDLEHEKAKAKDAKRGISAPWTTKRDWKKVDSFAAEELAKDKPEGDEALQSLFQKIYGDADDDQKKAMVKSFQTSGGTVLSTNWKDVKEKDYEGKDKVLPTGQDVREWEY